MKPRTWVMLIVGGVLSAAAFTVQQYSLARYGLVLQVPEWLWVHLVTGWVFLVAGIRARKARPDSEIGNLMIVFALIWVGSLSFVAPLIQWYDIGAAIALYGVLFVILLSFPTGRLRGWERWAASVWIGFVSIVALLLVGLSDYYAGIDDSLCCPEHLLLIKHDPALFARVRDVAAFIGVAAVLGLLGVLFTRWRRATLVARRKLTVGTIALPLMVVLVVTPFLSDTLSPLFLSNRQDLYIQNVSLLILPAVILTSLVRTRLTHARIADMMRDLDSASTPDALESRLRDTLQSRDARLLFSREGSDELVGVDGRRVDISSKGQSVTVLDEGATLVHEPELDEDLVRAAGAAAGLAIDNARLQAELRSQLIEVKESRRRLVSATDEARRSVERDLHDGAQQRLVTLSATLKRALNEADADAPGVEDLLEAAAQETDLAIADLRDLAHGMHPAILTQAGLGPAVASLIDRAPIPVTVDIGPGRYPPEVEATVYFFISEGLSNAFKHSGADSVHVHVSEVGEELNAVVADDGTGDADPAGSGLRGLRDRVGALGGRCEIGDSDMGGTKLNAWIPVFWERS